MFNPCPQCGHQNRQAARFCGVCGGQMPATTATPPPPPPAPPLAPSFPATSVPAPAQAVSSSSLAIPSAAATPAVTGPAQAAPTQSWFRRIFRPEPAVCGKVLIEPQERFDRAPTDWGRVLLLCGLLAGLAGTILADPEAFGQFLLLLGLLAAMLFLPMFLAGFMGFRTVTPMLNPLTWFSLGASLAPRRGQQDTDVPTYNFKVEDEATGHAVDVVMVGKRKGGIISMGDQVQVWGRRDRAHQIVKAHRVQVEQSMGRPADFRVSAARLTPIWIGPVVGVVLFVAAFLAGGGL